MLTGQVWEMQNDDSTGPSWNLSNDLADHEDDMNWCRSNLWCRMSCQDDDGVVRASDPNDLCFCCAGVVRVYRDSRPQLSGDTSSVERAPTSPCDRPRHLAELLKGMRMRAKYRVVVRLRAVDLRRARIGQVHSASCFLGLFGGPFCRLSRLDWGERCGLLPSLSLLFVEPSSGCHRCVVSLA
jgi:hypothetical protein